MYKVAKIINLFNIYKVNGSNRICKPKKQNQYFLSYKKVGSQVQPLHLQFGPSRLTITKCVRFIADSKLRLRSHDAGYFENSEKCDG